MVYTIFMSLPSEVLIADIEVFRGLGCEEFTKSCHDGHDKKNISMSIALLLMYF